MDQGTHPCCTFSPAVTSDPDTRVFQGDLSVTSELLEGKHQGWIMSTMPGPEGSYPLWALDFIKPSVLPVLPSMLLGPDVWMWEEDFSQRKLALNGQTTYSVEPYSHQSIQLFAYFYICTHMLASYMPTHIHLSFSLSSVSFISSLPLSPFLYPFICIYVYIHTVMVCIH